MEKVLIETLQKIVGTNNVLVEENKVQDYLKDETADIVRPHPAKNVIVVKPADTKEVSEVLKIACQNKICVFPRGGGTNLVGGAVPMKEGIVLSLERMNKIEIDKDNLMAVVEAGVTLEKLVSEVENANLSFPLHPGDESAQFGGLVAMNAGGANAIKHGVMRNYVKGIELVLSSGEVLELGGKLLKNNVGYDLMQLIIGSEGTLGIITKVIVRLFPKFQATAILIVPYNNRHDAVNTVPKILQDGRLPLAIEYAEKDLLVKTAEAIGEVWPVNQGSCYLLITMAEANRDLVLSESAKVAEICQENHCLEPLFAEPLDEQRKIVRIRSNIYSCLKQDTADILDVTVPPANIGKLLDEVDAVAEKYNAHLLSYGHVGDGNLHIHIIKSTEKSIDYIENLRSDIYEATVKLGGVITGEHGIGRTRVAYVNRFVNEKYLDLMKKIKRIFDPENILNPGVKLPS